MPNIEALHFSLDGKNHIATPSGASTAPGSSSVAPSESTSAITSSSPAFVPTSISATGEACSHDGNSVTVSLSTSHLLPGEVVIDRIVENGQTFADNGGRADNNGVYNSAITVPDHVGTAKIESDNPGPAPYTHRAVASAAIKFCEKPTTPAPSSSTPKPRPSDTEKHSPSTSDRPSVGKTTPDQGQGNGNNQNSANASEGINSVALGHPNTAQPNNAGESLTTPVALVTAVALTIAAAKAAHRRVASRQH